MSDLIDVPDKFWDLCRDWHSGQWCPLYAVASTGKIKDEHMIHLYAEASSCIATARDHCDPNNPDSYNDWLLMRELAKWADDRVNWENHNFNYEED